MIDVVEGDGWGQGQSEEGGQTTRYDHGEMQQEIEGIINLKCNAIICKIKGQFTSVTRTRITELKQGLTSRR